MSCATCGTPIGPGVLVCPQCGTQQSPVTGQLHRGVPTSSTLPGGAPLQHASQVGGVRENSNLALWSLILGILSWVMLPVLASIPAIILGHMARKEIVQSNGRLGGDGLAMGGLVTGYSSLVLACAVIPCIFMVFFGGLAAIGGAAG